MECLADLRHLDFCITTTLQYQGVICRSRPRASKRTTQMPPLASPRYFFSLLIPMITLRQLPTKGRKGLRGGRKGQKGRLKTIDLDSVVGPRLPDLITIIAFTSPPSEQYRRQRKSRRRRNSHHLGRNIVSNDKHHESGTYLHHHILHPRRRWSSARS